MAPLLIPSGGVRRLYPAALIALLGLIGLGATCSTPPSEITRERAIAIAQVHVSFEPDAIEAERATDGGRAVWRITFRGRLPGQPPELFETMIIDVDRFAGEIVSIGRT